MKNILLTGGLGYIGCHTCISLIEGGYNVFILDSLLNSNISVLKRLNLIKENINCNKKCFIKFFNGDIRDRKIINKIFKYSRDINSSIDAVIHFAGLKSIIESTQNPQMYWNVNVNGTKVLVDSMDKNNCKTIIFSSSATVYGNAKEKIIDEFCEINPINTYGKTKANAEKILFEKYCNSKGWRVINLRYFNPIGAHKSYLIGELPNKNATNLFPFICKAAIKEIQYLKIYGKDWDTKDGTCIRDFIHILDIASGHLAALNYLIKQETIYKSINLGTARGTSLMELVSIFEKVTEKKIQYSFFNRREGDVSSYVASNDLALKILNWEPKHTIEEMCSDGWNWFIKKYQEKY